MDDTISIFDVNRVKFLHHSKGHYMPGPDFPTGGLIMGNIGILKAYRTEWEHRMAVKVTGTLLEVNAAQDFP